LALNAILLMSSSVLPPVDFPGFDALIEFFTSERARLSSVDSVTENVHVAFPTSVIAFAGTFVARPPPSL
jgi:hypothetical protein